MLWLSTRGWYQVLSRLDPPVPLTFWCLKRVNVFLYTLNIDMTVHPITNKVTVPLPSLPYKRRSTQVYTPSSNSSNNKKYEKEFLGGIPAFPRSFVRHTLLTSSSETAASLFFCPHPSQRKPMAVSRVKRTI